jgi:hypothetical protein
MNKARKDIESIVDAISSRMNMDIFSDDDRRD